MARRLFKKERANLNRFADLIDQYAERIGARLTDTIRCQLGESSPAVECKRWAIDTPLGPMQFGCHRPWGEQGPPSLYECFVHFDDDVLAGAFLGHNGAKFWSGKWNQLVRYDDFDTPDDAAEWVKTGLDSIFATEGWQNDPWHVKNVSECRERDRIRREAHEAAAQYRREHGIPILA